MAQATTVWLRYLEALRPYLTQRDHRGRWGSLRWLELRMVEAGGKAGAVRNILYKDLGNLEEKRRFYAILAELYRLVDQEPPPPPQDLIREGAYHSLGRDKRRLFHRFVRELEEGKQPQIVAVGGAATGKSLLLAALQRALPQSITIHLGGELAQSVIPLADSLGVREEIEALLAQLSPLQPYALQGELQQRILLSLARGLNQRRSPLLLRAEAEGSLEGLPLRSPEGTTLHLAAWLEGLLQALHIPYLAALSEPPPRLAHHPLSPPSRSEARQFVREKLPDLPAERVEALINQAGPHFGELSRLVLLEAARRQNSLSAQDDPALGRLLEALAAFSPEADPLIPKELLERALGRPLKALSPAEQALFEWVDAGLVRPTLRSLLPTQTSPALHRIALDFFGPEHLFRRLYHAWKAQDLPTLLALIEESPPRLALLPHLWQEAHSWPAEKREALAEAVLRYRAVLGQYRHPEAEEALELLVEAHSPIRRIWARFKQAEAWIDGGRYEEAQTLLPALSEPTASEPTLQAEGLLIQAALERWKGDYRQAALYVQRAEALPVAPLLQDRIQLWRGLVAKDLGHHQEALHALQRVTHEPLLRGRARYQMGDLLMRLGSLKALPHMEEGLQLLEAAQAPKDEIARVRGRYATLLRRLGRHQEAMEAFQKALSEAQNSFTQARLESEAGILAVAQGHPFEALRYLDRAARYFQSTPERPQEARYRYLRTLFRIGAAYLLLEAGQPYCPPFVGLLEAPRASKLLSKLLRELPNESTERYLTLRLDTLTLLGLLLEPQASQELFEPWLQLEHPYLGAQVRLAYGEALLRAQRYGETLAQVLALSPLEDPGLQAQAKALEIGALWGLGEQTAAWKALGTLNLPRPFRLQLGHALGRLYPQLAANLKSELAPPEALACFLTEGSPPIGASDRGGVEYAPEGTVQSEPR